MNVKTEIFSPAAQLPGGKSGTAQKDIAKRGIETRLNWYLIAIILAVTVSVFSGLRSADFVHWDDDVNIYKNPHIRGLTAENVKWMFTDTTYIPRYMPLGWASLAIDYTVAGRLNPTTYHIGNLMLHAVNAVLIFLLLQRVLRGGLLLRHERTSDLPLPSRGRGIEGEGWSRQDVSVAICATIGALFWAIHPLRVEPVAWSSARIYNIATLLLLISVLAYLRHVSEGVRGKWYWISVVSYACSLLTYPIGLGFVVVLFLLEIYPLRRLELKWTSLVGFLRQQACREKISFVVFATIAFASNVWMRNQPTRWGGLKSDYTLTVLERLAQAFYVWACYLGKTIWPSNLCPTYTELLRFQWHEPRFLASFAAVAAVSALAFLLRKKVPGLMVLWVSYLVLLVPMLGLTEQQHHAYDRYTLIVAIIGSIAIAWGILRVWNQVKLRTATLACSAAALTLLGASSVQQATYWTNTDTLLPYIIAQLGDHPARAKQQVVLGVRRMEQGRLPEAEQLFRGALEVESRNVEARINLGDVLMDLNRREDALREYRTAVDLHPNHFKARQNLGIALGAAGKFSESEIELKRALQSEPDSFTGHQNLAITLRQLGKMDEAKVHFAEAERLHHQ